jgi:hypothetical protein
MLMAVHLLHRLAATLRRPPIRRALAQHLGKGANPSASAAAAGSSGNSSDRSVRSMARQLGSNPTTGTRAASGARSRRRVRRNTNRARPNCPVVNQVNPQHTVPRGDRTVKPAATSTRTAARSTCGSNDRVKQSGHSNTTPRGPRPAGMSSDRYRANRGSGRAAETPPNRAASGATALATLGTNPATRAASGKPPSA